MATKEEYAQLSLYVYNVTIRLDNRPELPSTDWTVLDYHPDDAIGFSYGIFRNNATGEVVVSYTGTNEKQVADFLLANLPARVGLSSLQVNAAARAATSAIKTYGDFAKAKSEDGTKHLFGPDGNYLNGSAKPGEPDLITGNAAADLIQGFGGDDALLGRAANDSSYANSFVGRAA